jgi:hypothetical protein
MWNHFFRTVASQPATLWVSIAALVISLISVTFTSLSYRRDRQKLKITAHLVRSNYEPDPGPPGHIAVNVVNVGRRLIYLTTLWGSAGGRDATGDSFVTEGPGIKLEEHQVKKFQLTHLSRRPDDHDAAGYIGDDIVNFTRMWIEDSTGCNHEIPGLKKLLAQLDADYREWCKETGYWKPPAPAQREGAPKQPTPDSVDQ